MNLEISNVIKALQAGLVKHINAGGAYVRLTKKEFAVADWSLKFGFVFIVVVLLAIIILSLLLS